MKMNFIRGDDENNTSISKWNGITVILRESNAFGELDVMFTGISKSGKAILAKLIPDHANKITSGGFGASCGDIKAIGKDSEGTLIQFTPGLLSGYVHVANTGYGTIRLPLLKGIFYTTEMSDFSHKCIGVDDPSLLLGFNQYNAELLQYIQTLKLVPNEKLFSEKWGRQLTVQVDKVTSWCTGIGHNVLTGEEVSISLNEFHRSDDEVRNKQATYITLFNIRQSIVC